MVRKRTAEQARDYARMSGRTTHARVVRLDTHA